MKTSKRILSLILCCIMVISLIPMTVSAGVMHIYYGDINENGRVEASDARLVLQKAASLITLTDRQRQIADVNEDGRVTAMDARSALRIAARIETPVVFETIGTADEVDYLAIYSEFLKNQDATISSNAEYEGKTGSLRYYSFCDAVICYLDEDEAAPELLVSYAENGNNSLYTLYRFYRIENGTVKMFKEFVDVRGMYSYGKVTIWNDPCENSQNVLYTRISAATMHSEYECKIIYPVERTIISIATVWDSASASMKTTVEYADGYKQYFKFAERSDIQDAVESYHIYTLATEATSVSKVTVINKDGSVEEKVIEESEQTDPVTMYAEFIRKQGKTRKIYSDMINKTNTFIYWDSAVCKLDKDSDVPNMILIYYNDNIQNDPYQPFPCYNIEIYTIKDGKVELVHSKQFIEAYCSIRFDLWRDPTTNSFELTEYDTFEGCSFSLCYPTDKELFANNWGMDNPYYAPGYEKYFTDTNIITHIDKYSAYTFSNTTSDTIRISVIDDSNNVETKTFDF